MTHKCEPCPKHLTEEQNIPCGRPMQCVVSNVEHVISTHVHCLNKLTVVLGATLSDAADSKLFCE